jgi:hypothetical protein
MNNIGKDVDGSSRGPIRVTFPGIYLEELRQTSKILRIVSVLAENRMEHLPSTSQKGYCLSHLLEYISRGEGNRTEVRIM